jgi:RNA recognition motif-containing protein
MQEDKMENKVYVGNLSFDVTDEDLEKLFSAYGKIEEVKVIKDRFSGKSKGFAFVTFYEKEDMKKAISEMNGKEVKGRELKVNEARPRESNDGPRRNFSKGRF